MFEYWFPAKEAQFAQDLRVTADGNSVILADTGLFKFTVWADGIVLAPDGNALFTDSASPSYIDQLARPPSREKLQAAAPYKIYKFKP